MVSLGNTLVQGDSPHLDFGVLSRTLRFSWIGLVPAPRKAEPIKPVPLQTKHWERWFGLICGEGPLEEMRGMASGKIRLGRDLHPISVSAGRAAGLDSAG